MANATTSKGGALTLLSGNDWHASPGATLILQNSTFQSNTAEFNDGGVVYLGPFATVIVGGDGNVFEGNTCGGDGAVVAASADAMLTVEGGLFLNNRATVRHITPLHTLSCADLVEFLLQKALALTTPFRMGLSIGCRCGYWCALVGARISWPASRGRFILLS